MSLGPFERFRSVAVITLNLWVGVLAAMITEPTPTFREVVAAFNCRDF